MYQIITRINSNKPPSIMLASSRVIVIPETSSLTFITTPVIIIRLYAVCIRVDRVCIHMYAVCIEVGKLVLQTYGLSYKLNSESELN